EGVGDFCCEYMTNGAVLNLGGFSKGFGNGMSGGFAYQYDPDGKLPEMISRDSVLFGTLVDGTPEAAIHEEPIKQMLRWHVEATGSKRAAWLLDDWDHTRKHMCWVMPKALLQYQDADAILAARPRKELVEELSTALAFHQIATLKAAWKQGTPIFRGVAPGYGETDTPDMLRLLNSYTVLEIAQTVATKRTGDVGDFRDKIARNLVLTEDFVLMSELAKHAKEAIAGYDDLGLATLVADKRLGDFKRALSLRVNVAMETPGTYAWIMHQDSKNRAAIGDIPSFDELFARHALPDVLARSAAEPAVSPMEKPTAADAAPLPATPPTVPPVINQ
ncbi:MAG: glutamate synthase large subunit, partial [Planctomycetota bacterium]